MAMHLERTTWEAEAGVYPEIKVDGMRPCRKQKITLRDVVAHHFYPNTPEAEAVEFL